jgi:hypothetical protein
VPPAESSSSSWEMDGFFQEVSLEANPMRKHRLG